MFTRLLTACVVASALTVHAADDKSPPNTLTAQETKVEAPL